MYLEVLNKIQNTYSTLTRSAIMDMGYGQPQET